MIFECFFQRERGRRGCQSEGLTEEVVLDFVKALDMLVRCATVKQLRKQTPRSGHRSAPSNKGMQLLD
jgi:hypothetical protein